MNKNPLWTVAIFTASDRGEVVANSDSRTRFGGRAAPEVLRETIETSLASGLETESEVRANTAELVIQIVTRLRTEADDDMRSKLVVGGFTNHPVRVGGMLQACRSCMYFLTHRRHCELPELDLPVKPHWSCRLWRI